MSFRELNYADIRALNALYAKIAEEGERNKIEICGRNFSVMPLNQKLRFRGDGWRVDVPTKYEVGKGSGAAPDGDTEAFMNDMMLLRMTLNVAKNDGAKW